ncbi:Ig-like domain-containing protein [Streptomyces sp. NPDC097610]|uniref:Ig-like domain-containing protein n=1 Tax=Streptomyces sp. NPDC097610 TaxID=3157227 RepID=UPI003324E7B5
MSIPTRRGKLVIATALAAVLGVATPAEAVASGTTVVVTPQSPTVGTPVQLTATVTCTGDPSGGLGMTFFDGSNLLNTVPVAADGQAIYSTTFSTVGTHTITAAYNGNGTCDASNGTTTVQVTTTPTQPPGLCLLACGGLIGFNVGDINNTVIISSRKHGHSAPPMR